MNGFLGSTKAIRSSTLLGIKHLKWGHEYSNGHKPHRGMTLMEHVVTAQWWIVIAIFFSILVTGAFSAKSIIETRKIVEQQTKVASANLAMELKKTLFNIQNNSHLTKDKTSGYC